MAKNREKQRFKKVVEHQKFSGNSASKKHWKSSKSSGIRVDRTHPNNCKRRRKEDFAD
jgi:hypothetical protein